MIQAIETGKSDRQVLLVDDVFRLIDFRDYETAKQDAVELHAIKSTLFSIAHGCFLSRMRAGLLKAQIEDRARAFLRRSARVKAGIDRARMPDDTPNRKGAVLGALARKRIADARASDLIEEIERVRLMLDPDRQGSLTAIAEALNTANVPTPSGRGRWHTTTAKRVLVRTARSLGT